jgi:hypothetical protein
MFVVSEVEAAAIRTAFEQGGELAAAVELRRLFPSSPIPCRRERAPGLSPAGSRWPRRCARSGGCTKAGAGSPEQPGPAVSADSWERATLKRCAPQVGSVNANDSFEQHDPPHGALIMFASTGTWRDLARPGGRMDVRRCRVGAAYAAVATLFRCCCIVRGDRGTCQRSN